MQKIWLSNNNIGDKGAESIAASLLEYTGIREIYLHNNNIGDKGAEKLADTFESNLSIKILELRRNSKISKCDESDQCHE